MECPYSSLVQHEEEKKGAGHGEDEIKEKKAPPEKTGPPAIPIEPLKEVEDGEAYEDKVLDEMERVLEDLPKVLPPIHNPEKEKKSDRGPVERGSSNRSCSTARTGVGVETAMIGGAAAAGAAGVGFFFNARRRLQGLLQ